MLKNNKSNKINKLKELVAAVVVKIKKINWKISHHYKKDRVDRFIAKLNSWQQSRKDRPDRHFSRNGFKKKFQKKKTNQSWLLFDSMNYPWLLFDSVNQPMKNMNQFVGRVRLKILEFELIFRFH
jgi:hypothetical protein